MRFKIAGLALFVLLVGACTTPESETLESPIVKAMRTARAELAAEAQGTVFPTPTKRVFPTRTPGPSPTPWPDPTSIPRSIPETPTPTAKIVFPTSVPTARPTPQPLATRVSTAPTATPSSVPTADGGVLRFTSSLDTIYYSVFGLDTFAIFDSIEANAPTIGTEPEGYFSAGLTEYEGQLEYQFTESLGFCWLESGSVELTFVVTLPRHEEADGLASSLLARWNQYKKEIAEHEQRHVDIFLETMREAEGGIEALSGRFPRCTSLEVAIDEVWDQALVANDAFQEEFHREVADLSRELRAPLEVQISNNQASRDQLESQIDSLIETSDQLRIEISELDDAMRSHGERIDELAAEYPDLVLPSGPYEEYEGLLSAWTYLNGKRNILVSRLNDSIEAANAAVDEFNVITTATNDLNKELNWLP